MKEIVLERFKAECDLACRWYRVWKETERDIHHNLWKEHLFKKEALYDVLREAGYTIDELIQIELKSI